MNKIILLLRNLPIVSCALLMLTLTTACSKDTTDDQDAVSLLIDGNLQSVAYISTYSDGSIALINGQQATLNYQVYPATAAQTIASQYANLLKLIVNKPLTEATPPYIALSANGPTLTIEHVAATAEGELTLDVSHTGFESGQSYVTALELTGSQLKFQSAYVATRLITPFAISEEDLSQTLAE